LVIDKITNIRFTYQSVGPIFLSSVQIEHGSDVTPRQFRGYGCRFRSIVRALEAKMAPILSYAMVGTAGVRRRLAAAGDSLMRRLGQFGRAVRNRAATTLAGLDDHMLADIGITRSDLRDAYAEPLWHDPTDVLAGRAAERRLRRRRSALVQSNDEPPRWLGRESAACR